MAATFGDDRPIELITGSAAEVQQMADAVRHHPGVGELRWVKAHDSWEGAIESLPGCPVAFDIVAEAEWANADPAVLFEAAASFLAWAREAEPRCRERV